MTDDFSMGAVSHIDKPNPDISPCCSTDGHWFYGEDDKVRECLMCGQAEKIRTRTFTPTPAPPFIYHTNSLVVADKPVIDEHMGKNNND